MKKVLLCSVLAIGVCKAQDVAFNNTQHSQVHLNPSFAGSNGYIRNQTIYRNQWPNMSGTFVTYGTCIDGYIKPIKGGFAVSVMSDDQARGTLRHTNAALTYAQYISIHELKIIPSIQVSYNQFTLDKGRLNYGDLINMRYGQVWNGGTVGPNWWQYSGPVPVSSVKYTNVGAGLLMNYQGNYFGVSCTNLTEPDISLLPDRQLKLPIRTAIHASTNWDLGKRTSSNLLAYYSTQGHYQSARVRMLNTYNDRIMYGAGYNFADLLSKNRGYSSGVLELYAGVRMKAFSLSYCYEHYFSTFPGALISHELSLSISLKKKDQERSNVLETR